MFINAPHPFIHTLAAKYPPAAAAAILPSSPIHMEENSVHCNGETNETVMYSLDCC